MQLVFDLFTLVSGLKNLLLQESLLVFLLIDLNLLLFYSLLVHFRHVTEKLRLKSDLTELGLKLLNLFGLLRKECLILCIRSQLLKVLLNLLYMLVIGNHKLLILLVEESLKTEVHHRNHPF